ncbi:MAG: hypothetical protein LLG01_02615 [Planctomycetaceae bacterium]|nr:hypothetical protein [Planctomycetaceae bacterium]
MKLICDLLLLGRHWVHYEAVRARQAVISTITAIVMMMLGGLLLLGAAGLLVTSAFIAISAHLGPALAALLTGGGLLAAAMIFVLLARAVSR